MAVFFPYPEFQRWVSCSSALVVFPSTTDLWDTSQGTVVITNSPVFPGCDINDIFGANLSVTEPLPTLFSDGESNTFTHFVEWATPNSITLGAFTLFAWGDAVPSNFREFSNFTLKAKSDASAADYDILV